MHFDSQSKRFFVLFLCRYINSSGNFSEQKWRLEYTLHSEHDWLIWIDNYCIIRKILCAWARHSVCISQCLRNFYHPCAYYTLNHSLIPSFSLSFSLFLFYTVWICVIYFDVLEYTVCAFNLPLSLSLCLCVSVSVCTPILPLTISSVQFPIFPVLFLNWNITICAIIQF